MQYDRRNFNNESFIIKITKWIKKLFDNIRFENLVNKTKNDNAKSFKIIFNNENDAQLFYNPSRKTEIEKKIIILMNFFNYIDEFL